MKDITDKIGIITMNAQFSCRNPTALKYIMFPNKDITSFYTAQNFCFAQVIIICRKVISSLISAS